MGSIQPSTRNVHFVGSVCMADTDAVFRKLATAFPKQLKRIPDGEPGKRGNFVLWQRSVFRKYPWLIRSLYFSLAKDPGPLSIPPEKLELLPIGYDEYAIESYSKFCQLREEGVIQKGVKFQVSLPTPINVLHVSIEPAYQPDIEPVYTKAYLACVRNIQDSIPAEDLAIQWDVACEFAFLEGIIPPPSHWVRSLKEDMMKRILELAHFVDEEIEMGFHFCYGDLGHQHFVQPKDMSLLVDIANGVLEGTRKKRPVNWVHMPVPRDRTDREYFVPLKDLDLQNTELYLGLLHQHDHDGTRRRIAAASEFVADFGIGTECGLGRADDVELESVVEIAKEITQ
ncbi:FAD binding domain-containing protein [Rutstroemia sp. NJR-2017a WRK4]|nr:FAD binding domain-containing protein [Rutstroemia sp. NJR-2017a WRK4]